MKSNNWNPQAGFYGAFSPDRVSYEPFQPTSTGRPFLSDVSPVTTVEDGSRSPSPLCADSRIQGSRLCVRSQNGRWMFFPLCLINGEYVSLERYIYSRLKSNPFLSLESLLRDQTICRAVRQVLSQKVIRGEAARVLGRVAEDIVAEAAQKGDASVANSADAIVKSGGAVWAPWMELDSGVGY